MSNALRRSDASFLTQFQGILHKTAQRQKSRQERLAGSITLELVKFTGNEIALFFSQRFVYLPAWDNLSLVL